MNLLILAALLAANDNWAEFRGPGGRGHSDSTGVPREWSESKNVVWKTAIPHEGWSSPVVWGKQIWLTAATKDGKQYFVICVDRETGKIEFNQKLFECEKPEDTRKFNTYASPTPVIEEGRVYVTFGSYGTACLDTATKKVVWQRTDLACNHWRAPGSSPILHGNLMILNFDGYDLQYVVALDKKTGATVWKKDRDYDFGTTDGDQKKGYATPIVIDAAGKQQLINPAAKALVSYDLKGNEIWKVRYPSHSPGIRPLFGHGLVYFSTGSPPSTLIAVRPDGQGDVTASHIVWKYAKNVGHKPSPILVDDLIYALSDSGAVVTCLDAKTGAEVWKQQRVPGTAHSASPIYVDGAIYVTGEDGATVVIQPGREYKELAKNKLEGAGRVMATPAVTGKSLILRTETNLYRVENR